MHNQAPMTPAPKAGSQPFANESATWHAETSRQLRWILFWTSLAMGAAVLAAVAGFATASLQPHSYGARAEIALYAPDLAELPEQYLATQTLFVRSHAILGPVAETFRVSTERLVEALSVDFPEGGALMRIQYVDRDRTIALQRLTAIVSAYLSKLEQLESRQNIRHDVLVPPFILEEPVRPRPLQNAAIGGAAGLTIVIVAFVLMSAREAKDRQA